MAEIEHNDPKDLMTGVEPQAQPSALTAEPKYRALFEATPIPLWEEDFSEVKKFIDSLRQDGVTDFQAHFDARPHDVLYCLEMVTVIDVNRATLALYKAANKQDLVDHLPQGIARRSVSAFQRSAYPHSRGAHGVSGRRDQLHAGR
ncbi:MAG: hypothetical protein R3D55_09265 [Chloroflexota bacterium]